MRRTGPDEKIRKKVMLRDTFGCVRCGDFADHLHHRRPRGMGGTVRPDANSPANLLAVCVDCHRYIEEHRTEAITNGWLVQQLDDPATVACLVERESRYVYLSNTGEYLDAPPVRVA